MAVFAYNPYLGALYAQNFARMENVPPGQRLFYYDPQDDCTNFISQCVWAAYGGWIPGFSPAAVAENEQRILQDVRQTAGVWYGSKQHIGSHPWCRVEEFFQYVTRQKEKGPQAKQVAAGDFESVAPLSLQLGDVVQMVVAGYAQGRFGHGLYVTRAGETWDEVHICCHSYERLNAPMSQFSTQPEFYRKLRVLRFETAAFER